MRSLLVTSCILASCADESPHLERHTQALVTIPSFVVNVDFAAGVGTTRSLLGVNKSPLESTVNRSGANCRTVPTAPRNYARLYRKVGITSVRLHDDDLDISKIYVGPANTHECTHAVGSAARPSDGCTDTTTPCRPAFDGSYIRWNPTCSQCSRVLDYDFSRADAAYRAVLEAGARPYLRLGESHDGPSYSTAPSARVATIAANVVRHFYDAFASSDLRATPEFIELWNEPDASFWEGNASSYVDYHVAMHQKLAIELASLGAATLLGASGFTSGHFMGARPMDGSFISDVLAQPVSLGFLSAHHYHQPPENEAFPSLGLHPSVLLSGLDALNASVRAYQTHWGRPTPAHLTEWNIGAPAQLPAGTSMHKAMASVMSTMLTLLQEPDSTFERAHFYAGRDNYKDDPVSDGGAGLFGYANDAFILRPAAFAMAMHRSVEGRPRALTSLSQWDPVALRNLPYTVREGAGANRAVLAVASGEGLLKPGHDVVVTNTKRDEATVKIVMRNLPPQASMVSVEVYAPTTCDPVIRPEARAGALVPREDDIVSAWSQCVSTLQLPLQRNSSGEAGIVLSLPSHGVARLWIGRAPRP